MHDAVLDRARALNQTCFCITLDRDALARALNSATGAAGFYEREIATRAHLFSSVPVFLPAQDYQAMVALVHAIEAAAQLPAYQRAAFADAPEASRRAPATLGVMMGYDFHLGEGPPRLIEINTNAGGAFLNAFSGRAQLACCEEVARALNGPAVGAFEQTALAMFREEWRRARGPRPLRRIAIVDDGPERQYLYPEFLLAQRMFESEGVAAMIADPTELDFSDGALRARGEAIDLVYNRLTDFALVDAHHAALRQAWLAGAVVVTPEPAHHALLADKRNLVRLSDPDLLASFGAADETIATLASIPRAQIVDAANAATLWANRKNLFFKPWAGHGGKAVYRGDKLTRGTWAQILEGGYIAQELAPPGERLVLIDDRPEPRKVDVRLYTYAGAPLMTAARIYQGQTTNFRTEGGGFAPVFFA